MELPILAKVSNVVNARGASVVDVTLLVDVNIVKSSRRSGRDLVDLSIDSYMANIVNISILIGVVNSALLVDVECIGSGYSSYNSSGFASNSQ